MKKRYILRRWLLALRAVVARAGRRPSVRARVRDRLKRRVTIARFRPGDRHELLALYRGVHGAQRTRGLPPIREEQREVWVDHLTRRGVNLLAWVRRRVVGHVVLLPDRAGSYELAVFVHPDYQEAGIGRALIAAALPLVESTASVWLSVERRNTRAIALYRRMGFERVSGEADEEVWVLGGRRA